MNMKPKQERRSEKRFPVLQDLDIPITLELHGNQEVEGILLNLSATGIGLIAFTTLKVGLKVNLSLNLGDLLIKNLHGKVIWCKTHKNVIRIGIHFTKIDKVLAREIQKIAEDYTDCEIKLTLGVKDICFTECKYYNFCTKKVKA